MIKQQYLFILECDRCGDKENFATLDVIGLSMEDIVQSYVYETEDWGWQVHDGKLFCGNFCKEEYYAILEKDNLR